MGVFEKDYLMRQVHSLAGFLAKLLLDKEEVPYEEAEEREQTDLLFRRLQELIAQRQLNQAEDLLYVELQPGNARYLELAIDFYDRLNQLDDETLEAADFPREEIEQGLKDIAARFGMSFA